MKKWKLVPISKWLLFLCPTPTRNVCTFRIDERSPLTWISGHSSPLRNKGLQSRETWKMVIIFLFVYIHIHTSIELFTVIFHFISCTFKLASELGLWNIFSYFRGNISPCHCFILLWYIGWYIFFISFLCFVLYFIFWFTIVITFSARLFRVFIWFCNPN